MDADTLSARLCLRIMLPFLLAAFLLATSPVQQLPPSLTSNGATLTVNSRSITITKSERSLVDLQAIRFNYFDAEAWEVLEATADSIVLRLTYPPAADHHRVATDDTPRLAELSITRVSGGFRLRAEPSWANQTTLDLNDLGDHFFGLSALLQPDNRRSPDLAGSVVDVEVDAQGQSLKENYASAFSAFYMSSLGYGAFFDTFAKGQYQFAINGLNQIHHETGTLDWYVFVGDDGAAIHEHYFAVVGRPKPVPAWGLGPIGWRDQNDGGAAEILADVEHMNELRMPFTAWFVDRPYSDGTHAWSEMNFSDAFADPGTWIARLRDDYGLEFMTWTSAATFGDERFDEHLAGKFSYVDLSHPPSVGAFKEALTSQQYVHGVKGHKVDRADENLPVYEDWHDASVRPDERRNRYAYLHARVHDEALREHWGADQVTFARAAIHRTQPYLSAIWGGDPRSTWEGMQSNFANAIRSSFMGFPVWGTDVGGYLGEGRIPQDLYVRWMQAGSMTGLFEIKLDGAGGSGEDRMPWHYGPALQAAFRAANEDRMRFVPYLYSLSRTSATTGTLMQPLAYRHLDDPATYDVWDQFYLGDAIMVAPVFEPASTRTVYLPDGSWRDFDDPATRYEGGQTIEVDAPLARLPRFVRDNSVYVTGDVYRGNTRLWSDGPRHLVIHAAPGAPGSSTDFTYVDMLEYDQPKRVVLAHDEQGVSLSVPAFTIDATAAIILDKSPSVVTVNGERTDASYDASTRTLTVHLETGRTNEVIVR